MLTPPSSLLRMAKEHLLEGRLLPESAMGSVQDVVARSWARSRALGLDPAKKALFSEAATRVELRHIGERARRLIDAVAPEAERVAAALNNTNTSVLCTDADGTIVHARNHGAVAPRELRDALSIGRRLTEQEFGTTAPGCVLAEHAPVMVLGEEHFLNEVGFFVCAAAPIFDFDGSFAGIFDVTGCNVPFDEATAEMVNVAARASEHRLFATAAPGLHLRFHVDPRFLHTPLAGMIALEGDGRILGGCSNARRMLGAPHPGERAFLHDVLTIDLATLQRRLHASGVVEVTLQQGGNLYICLETPNRARSPHVVVNGAATAGPASPPAPRSVSSGAAGAAGGSSATGSPVMSASPFVHHDPALHLASERACRAFARGVPILLFGETGTGKDVIARTLHQAHRPNGPLISINCSAIPEGLIEAELFGYADGSFTGARRGGAMGKIAHADGGTLFLDEIGDMDLRLQARLLHFLQTRTLTRLGDARATIIDCAIVCATHRDLEAMVERGQFREDLYHRINGLLVELPPLRERTDFDHLVAHFLEREAGAGCRLSPDVRAKLASHPWRGNVRELEQVIRTAVALSDGAREILVDHLPPQIARSKSESTAPSLTSTIDTGGNTLQRVTTAIVQRTLAEHGGNVSAAARALGVSRGTLYKKARGQS